jgi:glucosamine-phosphate N-acetyltransferase
MCSTAEQGYLFPSSFINHEPNEDPNLIARPLHVEDFKKGYTRILSQLTEVGNVSEEKFIKRFREFQLARDVYYVVVIEDVKKQQIIGAATLVIEKKMIHECGSIGHIEDVVVDSTYRGKNLGLRVTKQLVHIGKQLGCYKIILDCSEKNVPFYEKAGFKQKEYQMALYLNTSKL